jgi:hypothetical protein
VQICKTPHRGLSAAPTWMDQRLGVHTGSIPHSGIPFTPRIVDTSFTQISANAVRVPAYLGGVLNEKHLTVRRTGRWVQGTARFADRGGLFLLGQLTSKGRDCVIGCAVGW